MTRVVLTFSGQRCPTVNQVYGTMNRWQRAAAVKVWRELGHGHARIWMQRVYTRPTMPVTVTATPLQANRRHLTDCGAVLPAVKGVIDGCVDAGLLPSDGPDVVVRLIFEAPRVCDKDGLEVVIEGVS